MLRCSFSALAIQRLTVVGAGTMGAGLSQVAAAAKCDVTLVDVSDEALARGKKEIAKSAARLFKKSLKTEDAAAIGAATEELLSRIKTTTDVKAAIADVDLVVEAIVEKLAVKNQLWKSLDSAAPPSTIFATNTSTLLVGEQSAVVSPQRAKRFAGLHFFAPVPMMKLVEVVKAQTDQAVVDDLMEFSRRIGKTPICCADTKGFVVNRLLIPLNSEAYRLVQRQVATLEDVDIAMKLGAGMAMGPFEVSDLSGLDVCRNALLTFHESEPDSPMWKPVKLLDDKVAAGKLGRKTGEGFYRY
jgi:3-hydroxyacyl-CoA dehydrogenase